MGLEWKALENFSSDSIKFCSAILRLVISRINNANKPSEKKGHVLQRNDYFRLMEDYILLLIVHEI